MGMLLGNVLGGGRNGVVDGEMVAASAETPGAVAALVVSAVEISGAAEPTVTGDVGGKVEAKLTNLVERMKAAFSSNQVGYPLRIRPPWTIGMNTVPT